jgi:hypothetical protein
LQFSAAGDTKETSLRYMTGVLSTLSPRLQLPCKRERETVNRLKRDVDGSDVPGVFGARGRVIKMAAPNRNY